MLREIAEGEKKEVKVRWEMDGSDAGFFKVLFKDSSSNMVEYTTLCDGADQ
jgi:hypothetical protein